MNATVPPQAVPAPPDSPTIKPPCDHPALSPRLLNKEAVLLRIGVKGTSTLDDMIRQGRFPKASAYMNRKPFWTLEAVDAWVDSLLTGQSAA